ncbi:hypothetical protein ACFVYA_17350 [Amycolatopsis sp. NPDC058278]
MSVDMQRYRATLDADVIPAELYDLGDRQAEQQSQCTGNPHV